jgi:hypothetical protein
MDRNTKLIIVSELKRLLNTKANLGKMQEGTSIIESVVHLFVKLG